jgi:hypothetical protein
VFVRLDDQFELRTGRTWASFHIHHRPRRISNEDVVALVSMSRTSRDRKIYTPSTRCISTANMVAKGLGHKPAEPSPVTNANSTGEPWKVLTSSGCRSWTRPPATHTPPSHPDQKPPGDCGDPILTWTRTPCPRCTAPAVATFTSTSQWSTSTRNRSADELIATAVPDQLVVPLTGKEPSR